MALRLVTLLAPTIVAASKEATKWPAGDWTLNLLSTAGAAPSSRQGHAAVEVGRKIYFIGGCQEDMQCFNDVRSFDSDTQEWTEEPTIGWQPTPRGGHTATLVGNEIYLYGGADSKGTFNDLYKLDLRHLSWSKVPFPGGDVPKARTNHAAAAGANGRLYLFGGYSSDGTFLNDTWQLRVRSPKEGADEVQWQKLAVKGQVPAGREGHSLNIADSGLILFGGSTADGRSLNDLHAFNVETLEWKKVHTKGQSPAPRQAHSAARHGQQLIIAGGCDVSQALAFLKSDRTCFNDVWSLDLPTSTWSKKQLTEQWAPREGHTASFIAGQMFLFGGCQLRSDKCFGDMITLNTKSPCPNGCSGRGECVEGRFCRCSTPGFGGHDCAQPLTCRVDCGDHGTCNLDGSCLCHQGWQGIGCFQSMVPQKVALIATEKGAQPVKGAPPVPQVSDFGMMINTKGQTGFKSPCQDNCNFRGLCEAGTCYCQPGYTGTSCGTEQATGRVVSLQIALGVAGGIFLISAIIAWVLELQKYNKMVETETKSGYNA